ncbi:MAG: hypothetical protein ABSA21_03805 [Candidatus Limnocylindrales bacterium]|jgi:hypothetical protein
MKTEGPPRGRDGQPARLSAVAFGALGTGLVTGGVVSIAAGIPHRAYDMAPLSGPADLVGRLGEISPLVAAALAALVVASVVVLLGARRLRAASAAAELLVLGVALEVCVIGASGRIGYAADGSVLLAGVACISGGSAVIAAGLLAALVRE